MTRQSSCSQRIEPVLALVAVLALLPLGACGSEQDAGGPRPELATATKGLLSITVSEGGDLESARPVSIRSRIEKRTAILDMVPEGTRVKAGDFLVRLDSADLEDRLNRAESDLEKARSDHAQAEENLQIQLKKNTETLKAADTDLVLARRALEGYMEGEYPLEKQKLESEILLAQAELARAQKEAEASARLFKLNYISRTELEADQIDHKRRGENLAIAQRNLKYLDDWTKPDRVKRLQADVDLADLAKMRMQQQAQSELVQKQDTLAARKRSYDLQLEATNKIKEQLKHVEILAPSSGLVVYGRERGSRHRQPEPIAIGKEVREGEELIRIPDLTNMVVEVDIHESSIKKVQQGQRAVITVDAIPNESFPGVVERVALVPSSQSSWMNPDLKVYTCRVRLQTVVSDIKPGMHAQVKIFVQELEDATQVPLQAVHQSGNRSFVYLPADDRAELREVEVGASNESMVQIVKGIAPGDRVFIVPPPDRPELPKPEDGAPEAAVAAKSPPDPAARGGERPANMGEGGPRNGRGGGGTGRGARGGRGGRGKMTEEQRKKMRERMANMTEEQRKEFFRKMRARRTSQN